jgi:hypothetical protein
MRVHGGGALTPGTTPPVKPSAESKTKNEKQRASRPCNAQADEAALPAGVADPPCVRKTCPQAERPRSRA